MNEIIKNIIGFGEYGPIVLFFSSIFLLYDKSNLVLFYLLGFVLNVFLNLILKGIFQQPRPNENIKLFNLAINNAKKSIFLNGIPFNIYGMPSGHAQSCFYSLVFIYLALKNKNKNIIIVYILIAILTLYQRYYDKFHTILQLFVGSIVGSIFAFFIYYLSKKQIMGKLIKKPDDNAPL
jgi:membrane-associated phospholipid phosphatase